MSDRAALWTALGVLCFSSAMIWVLETPERWSPDIRWLPALFVTAIGLIFIAIGWNYIKKSEDERRKEKEKEDIWKKKQDERREVEHVEYLATLRIIAKRLGANSVVTKHQVEREAERFKEERKRRDDGELEDEL